MARTPSWHTIKDQGKIAQTLRAYSRDASAPQQLAAHRERPSGSRRAKGKLFPPTSQAARRLSAGERARRNFWSGCCEASPNAPEAERRPTGIRRRRIAGMSARVWRSAPGGGARRTKTRVRPRPNT